MIKGIWVKAEVAEEAEKLFCYNGYKSLSNFVEKKLEEFIINKDTRRPPIVGA